MSDLLQSFILWTRFGYWNTKDYAIMLLNMQVESPSLRQLKRALTGVKNGRIATQEKISARLGIPQSTISRAMGGKLKRETATTARLLDYANMLLAPVAGPDRLQQAVVDYLNAGGDADRLADLVKAATNVFRSHGN